MVKHAWAVPAAGLLLAPFVIWLPMLGGRFGLPAYPHSGQAVDLWHFQVFYLAALALIAVVVGAHDRYLGAAIGLAALLIFYRGARIDPTHTVLFAFAALALLAVRSTPERWRGTIIKAAIGIAIFQALYIVGQWFGYDPGFGRFSDGLEPRVQTVGSIGTVGSAASFLAIVGPLMPLSLLPLVFLAVCLTYSRTAIIALAIGLAIRYRASKVTWAAVAAGAAVFAIANTMKGSVSAGLTASTRVQIWTFGLADWVQTDPLFGYGLGGWFHRIPGLQKSAGFAPTGEVFAQAHNEYVQWIAETGLVGLVLLGLWLWSHRAIFTHATYGGSLVALAVDSVTWFPFHVVPVALLALIVVGLAMSPLTTDPVGG
jgi:O-antigen ligase